ncbi:MAG TPA: lipase family protein [Pyrinomonadaceae bacterium]|nr:lipase family protein [Pyrinomonadaceae bacterium]
MDDQLGASGGNGNNGQDVAMTLAAITYCADIKGALQQYLPDWQLVWLPDKDVNGNYAYIARHKRASQYAVAIRGSLLDFSWAAFDNWFKQDFNVFEQVDWTYPSSSQKPKISQGSADGLNDLTSLVQTNPGGRTTMLQYLMANAVAQGASIVVTGHSLGGNLTTVFAPWLLYQIKQAGKTPPTLFPVFTFAAPTAGNTAFAAAYDASFPNSWRYYNVLDIVPRGSMPSTVMTIGELYTPSPLASQISVTYDGVTLTFAEAIDAIAAAIGASEIYPNGFSFYSQTNTKRGSVPLTPDSSYCPVTDKSDPLIEQWFEKAGCEHGHNTYLQLLGAKPVNCKQVLLTP